MPPEITLIDCGVSAIGVAVLVPADASVSGRWPVTMMVSVVPSAGAAASASAGPACAVATASAPIAMPRCQAMLIVIELVPPRPPTRKGR